MAKLEILTSSEQTAFDSPPHFSESEQENYFHLPSAQQQWLKTVTHPTNQVGFILLWGYCQAASRFFQPVQFYQSDIEVICKRHGIAIEAVEITAYRQRTFNHHKQIISEHLGLQPFNDEAKTFFSKRFKIG